MFNDTWIAEGRMKRVAFGIECENWQKFAGIHSLGFSIIDYKDNHDVVVYPKKEYGIHEYLYLNMSSISLIKFLINSVETGEWGIWLRV